MIENRISTKLASHPPGGQAYASGGPFLATLKQRDLLVQLPQVFAQLVLAGADLLAKAPDRVHLGQDRLEILPVRLSA